MQNGFLLAKDYSNMQDNDIVSLIQNGDSQALDYILSKYNSIVNI